MPNTHTELSPEEVETVITFAYQISQARKARGWTQEDLALRVGMRRGAIAHLEAARTVPNLIHMERLAKALQISFLVE